MNAEILAVGTELLLGNIVNTNARFLAEKLAEEGIFCYYQSVVGDNPERLRAVLETALSRADLVITSGGLGPTCDDLTKETIAAALGVKLVPHEESLTAIRAFFEKTGRVMTENNIKQALLPEGCTVFDNPNGTAPGCAVEKNGKVVMMLPGPPREFEPMVVRSVVPYLRRYSEGVLVSRNVRIFGVGESRVESMLLPLLRDSVNPTVAPYCKAGEVTLRVTARAATEEEAFALTEPAVQQIKDTLGRAVYGVDCESLEEAVSLLLRKMGKTLSAAESCTGGMLGKRMTDLPGASDVYLGGCVTYANEAKEKLLGVRHETLLAHGAVSEETAREMAEGMRAALGSDYAISLTGIAGPGGGSEEKPVGLVFIGIAGEKGTEVYRLLIANARKNRDLIRTLAVSHALDFLRRRLEKEAEEA